MNKTLNKFAIAMLVAGATVTATSAMATVATNAQVLDNISVQVKIYYQGSLKGTSAHPDTALEVSNVSLTTADLIQQLDLISGLSTSTVVPRTSKLVLSTYYTNELVGNPGTQITNINPAITNFIGSIGGSIYPTSGAGDANTPGPSTEGGSATTAAVDGSDPIATYSTTTNLSWISQVANLPATNIFKFVDTGTYLTVGNNGLVSNSDFGNGTVSYPQDAGVATAGATSISGTNAYLITNSGSALGLAVYQIYMTGSGSFAGPSTGLGALAATNLIGYITNGYNIILSNNAATFAETGGNLLEASANSVTNVVATLNTNVIYSTEGSTLGYWTMLVPQVSLVATTGYTNVVITQYSPTNSLHAGGNLLTYTNAGYPSICIMTAKSGGTFNLYDVSKWISFDSGVNPLVTVYGEAGTNLDETDFTGANSTSQTEYSINDLKINILYATNGTVSAQTNLVFDPVGFTKATRKVINLVTGGTLAEKLSFQTLSTETINAAGNGYIGGTFTANGTNVYTSAITGLTNTPTYGAGTLTGTYVYGTGTALITNSLTTNTVTAIPAIMDGTVTVSYLGTVTAADEVFPKAP